MDVLGTRVVILGSLAVAQDLLEKRGTIYSDSPTTHVPASLIAPINAYPPRY